MNTLADTIELLTKMNDDGKRIIESRPINLIAELVFYGNLEDHRTLKEAAEKRLLERREGLLVALSLKKAEDWGEEQAEIVKKLDCKGITFDHLKKRGEAMTDSG